MEQLVQLGGARAQKPQAAAADRRRPEWLRVKVKHSDAYREVGALLDGLSLNTVCKEARCPNIWECWGEHRTATFMILGDVCTRFCRYCSVTSGKPGALPDPKEPENVAEAVQRLALRHTVLTSVDRDDLDDYGAGHWAACIEAIRERSPSTSVEVLIPDFLGDEEALLTVLKAAPAVLAHNTETVAGLYRRMRPKGDYRRAMQLLRRVHEYRQTHDVAITSKSGLMVGLGETFEQVVGVLEDLRAVDCDVVTIGQYLNPTKKHAQVQRFVHPDEFAEYKRIALELGFTHCESGPLVRSSYHAHEHIPDTPLRDASVSS